MKAAILNSAIMDFPLRFSHFAQKKLHSFILTQLDDGSHHDFCPFEFRDCHLGFRRPCYLLSDSLKNTLTPFWIWLKLIQSDSNSFILTQLDDGSHLEFCHLWIQLFCTKNNFTHSFWLNLMMAAILNSALLDSETAILDSDDLLSSLRFTQKHSHSILTLTQTNSIWLKLIHSDWTWWWQPSWILGHLGFRSAILDCTYLVNFHSLNTPPHSLIDDWLT